MLIQRVGDGVQVAFAFTELPDERVTMIDEILSGRRC